MPPAEDGTVRRTRIVRCDGPEKVSSVRLEETLRSRPAIPLPGDVPRRPPELLRQVAMAADHVIVRLRDGATEEDLRGIASALGCTIRRRLRVPGSGTYLVDIPGRDVDSLTQAVARFRREAARVAYAEPDYIVHALEVFPDDPSFPECYGLHNTGQTGGTPDADIDAPEAWALATGDALVLVGVIDTGIDYTHPDLAANIWTHPGESGLDSLGRDKATNGVDDDGNGYVDDVHGWDFANNDRDPMDDHFHGTHCAGTLGAVGNNGQGVAGVCWQVRMMALKFLNAQGSGLISDATEAVAYATARGVTLTSNSWGGGDFSQSFKDALDAASAAGVLFVAAAGNDGSDNDREPSYPASYVSPNVIAVAATDDQDQLAWFSNYGAWSVDLGAPGYKIFSTLPVSVTSEMAKYGLAAQYGTLSGTSMATPHVSGALALARAFLPGLTAADLKGRLLQRVDVLPALVGVTVSNGRLNLFRLLDPDWHPIPADLTLRSVTLSDAEGNGDRNANPGETVSLAPAFMNQGQEAASSVQVEITCSHPGITLLPPTVIDMADLTEGRTGQPAAPFRLQVGAGVPDEEMVTVRFTARFNGNREQSSGHEFPVANAIPRAEVTLSSYFGDVLADPVRNWVYVTDRTDVVEPIDYRLFVIDTDLGRTVRRVTLPHMAWGLALSPDGSRLFVTIPHRKEIRVFNLPDVSLYAVFRLDFKPAAVACCAGNRLYAADFDGRQPLRRLDARTGALQESFGFFPDYNTMLLKRSQDGRKLYVAWTWLGYGYFQELDVTVPGMGLRAFEFWDEEFNDFCVDETRDRFFTMCTYWPGVQITDMQTGDFDAYWPIADRTGMAVAMRHGGPRVYGGGSRDLVKGITEGLIRKFRASDGRVLADYYCGDPFVVRQRGLAVTPNDRVFYVFCDTTSHTRIGILGADSLDLFPPDPHPAARFASTAPLRATLTPNGLWHPTTHRTHGGATSGYYGQEGVWNYDTGAQNQGTLTSDWFYIPAGTAPALKFWQWRQTEGRSMYDVSTVRMGYTTSGFSQVYQSLDESAAWVPAEAPLSSYYHGKYVQAQFKFDTVNAGYNTYEGWYVDDLAQSPAAGVTPLPVTFDGGASTTPDAGGIVGHRWDFGDGAIAVGNPVSHTFAAEGLYTVTLTVTDAASATAVTSQQVPVSPVQAKLLASDGGSYQHLGHSVAIDGDYAVVGTDSSYSTMRKAYVFARSGGAWGRQAVLDPGTNAYAQAVAISGDTAVVGAPADRKACVYVRSGSSWSLQATVVPGGSSYNSFGYAVALEGDTLAVVSVPSVYVFTRSAGVWTQQAELTTALTDRGLRGAQTLALSGDTLAVADWSVSPAGWVKVYTRAGAVWTQEAMLTAPGSQAWDGFGRSVALAGDTLVVGTVPCLYDDNLGEVVYSGLGCAYAYARAAGSWTLQQKLFASDGRDGDGFGEAVSLSGSRLLVGASCAGDLGAKAGKAYTFVLDGGRWRAQSILVSTRGAGDKVRFGAAARLSGDQALIGSPADCEKAWSAAGAAFFMTLSDVPPVANQPPVPLPQTVDTLEDTPAYVTLAATDPENDTLTFVVVDPPQHGSVAGNPPYLLYIPAPGYAGPDAFTFKAVDPYQESGSAAVSINVMEVNDPPVACPDVRGVPAGGSVDVSPLANDIDPDGDTLTIAEYTQPAHGAVSSPGGGILQYAAETGFTGEDVFTYTVSDGRGGTAVGAVSLRVGCLVGDWPSYAGGAARTGCLPSVVGPGVFVQDWSRTDVPGDGVVVGAGRAYRSYTGVAAGNGGKEQRVAALDPATGATLWEHAYPLGESICTPSYDGGRIFLQRGCALVNGEFRKVETSAVDAATGVLQWVYAAGTQSTWFPSPTVSSDSVYDMGGVYGGLYAFDRSNGAYRWFYPPDSTQSKPETHGFYEGVFYSLGGGFLRSHHPTAGFVRWQAPAHTGLNNFPALVDGRAYVVESLKGLLAVDLRRGDVLWSVPDTSAAYGAAVHRGVAYFCTQARVRSCSTADGSIRLTFTAPATLNESPIVTEDRLLASALVSSRWKTYVFDVETASLLQTLDGKASAIANGRLYTSDGMILRTYVVAATNEAPTISAIPDRIIPYGSPSGPIPVTVGDDHTPAVGLQVVCTASDNTSLVHPSTVVLGGSGADRTASVTPNPSYIQGVANLTLMVSDGERTTSTTFRLTVAPPVTPPAAPSNLSGSSSMTTLVNLSWTDNANNESGFKVERKTSSDGTFVPIGTTGMNVKVYSNGGLAAGTTYWYRVCATNPAGDSAFSNVAAVTTQGVEVLPPPWLTQDIGSVGVAGSASFGGTAGFTLRGSGDDIWNTADAFRIVYQTLTGDGEIRARVVSVDNTHPWAKAGVMMRETLDADSKHAMMVLTPGNGLAFQRRTTTGGTSVHTAGESVPAPYWVRLVRQGNVFSAYVGPNSSTWTPVGTETLPMASTILVGMAVTAHDNGLLCAAQIDNVVVYRNTWPSGAPAAPTSLSAAAVSIGQVDLAWSDNAVNEVGFKIERKAGLDGVYVQVASTGPDATTYHDTGVAAGTQYYYRVRAVNLFGNSAYSNEATATTPLEVSLPTNAGYTLVALPVAPAAPLKASGLVALLIGSDLDCTRVLRFNGTGYDVYTAGGGGTDFDVRPGEGYFVRCTNAGLWRMTGYRFDAGGVPLQLVEGYNLIGLPVEPSSPSRYTASVVVSEIAAQEGDATRILRFDGTGYEVYTAGGVGLDFRLTPGEGYFIRCSKTSTWTVTK